MKRAWVVRGGWTPAEPWTTYLFLPDGSTPYRTFPTHATALAHALHEVGLTPTEKETN